MLNALGGRWCNGSWRFHFLVLVLPALFAPLIYAVESETTPRPTARNATSSDSNPTESPKSPKPSPNPFEKPQPSVTSPTESEDVTETPQLALPLPPTTDESPPPRTEPESSEKSDSGYLTATRTTPANLESVRSTPADQYVVDRRPQDFLLPTFRDNFNPWWQVQGLKFRIGIFHLRLSLEFATEYNDNIYYTANNHVHDLITSVTPFLLLGSGDWIERVNNFALCEYSPALTLYSKHSAQNNVPQNLTFLSQFGMGPLVNRFRLFYALTTTPTADQVGLHDYQTLDTAIVSSYSLGGRTHLENTLNAIYENDDAGISYFTLSTAPRVRYQLHDKLALFLGASAGIVFVHGGSAQPYEQLNAGFEYSTLSKLTVRGAAGCEIYQTRGISGQAEQLIAPTFAVGLSYEVRQTTIGLSIIRDVEHSGFVAGQTYINNAITLIGKQRIFGRLDLRLDLQYQILQYQGLSTDNRTDTFLVAVPRIDYSFWKDQAVLSLYYRIQQRDSKVPSIAYNTNIFGMAIRLNF